MIILLFDDGGFVVELFDIFMSSSPYISNCLSSNKKKIIREEEDKKSMHHGNTIAFLNLQYDGPYLCI